MKINVIGGKLTQEELKAYENYACQKEPNCTVLDIELDGEYANLTYHVSKPFERIRRITGYLVGTVNKWNASKKAELESRVKHNI